MLHRPKRSESRTTSIRGRDCFLLPAAKKEKGGQQWMENQVQHVEKEGLGHRREPLEGEIQGVSDEEGGNKTGGGWWGILVAGAHSRQQGRQLRESRGGQRIVDRGRSCSSQDPASDAKRWPRFLKKKYPNGRVRKRFTCAGED